MPGLRIATSTSRTGTTFAGESTNPFPDIAVGQPRAWALGGNSLRLFYVQAGNIDTAVSNDGGLTWTKETYAQLQQLVAAGIDVRFDPMYPGGLLFIHSKAIVRDVGTDNAMAFVGSQNPGDNVSLNSERELGILLGKDSIINKMTAVYERDWAASQPLTIVNGVPKNPFSGS